MEIIWYNPEQKQYQRGDIEEYRRLTINHPMKEAFKLLFEFNTTSVQLIDKVMESLSLCQNPQPQSHISVS